MRRHTTYRKKSYRKVMPAYLIKLQDGDFAHRSGYVYCQRQCHNHSGMIHGWDVWRFTEIEFNLMLRDAANWNINQHEGVTDEDIANSLWSYITSDSEIEPWSFFPV